MPMRGTDLYYGSEHKSKLWALVTDDTSREVFYQHCLSLDTSKFRLGQAPFTKFKSVMQSKQAPPAIKWLKHAICSAPDIMAYVPADCKDEDERVAVLQAIQDKKLFYLKHRDATFFQKLVGDQYNEQMLKSDIAKMSQYKTMVPARHVADCIQQYFKGQAYRSVNEDDSMSQLTALGLSTDKVGKVCGRSKRVVVFPSIESLHYLLCKGKWEDSMVKQEEEDEGEAV